MKISEIGFSMLSCIVLASVALKAWASEEVKSGDDASAAVITMGEVVPFSASVAGEIGPLSPTGAALRRIRAKCDLERILAESIAATARREGILVVLVPRIEETQGRILVIEIEAAVGLLGGAVTGTKSLTLRSQALLRRVIGVSSARAPNDSSRASMT